MLGYNAREGVAMVRNGSKDRRQHGSFFGLAAAPAPIQAHQRDVPVELAFKSAADEARAARVEYLRGAVAAGTYHVDSLTIADRLIERLFLYHPRRL
jgi:hypothetical protein